MLLRGTVSTHTATQEQMHFRAYGFKWGGDHIDIEILTLNDRQEYWLERQSTSETGAALFSHFQGFPHNIV